MSDGRDPFEDDVAARLRASVGDEPVPADLADRAVARRVAAARRRNRTRALVGAGTALVVVGMLALVAAPSGSDGKPEAEVDAAAPERPTTTSVDVSTTSTTEAPAEVVPTTTEPTPRDGGAGPPSPAPPSEPPPDPLCVQATGEPTSWEQGWDGYIDRWYTSKPEADQPASIRMCVDDATPRVGQAVVITLVGDDPDAPFVDDECGWQIWWNSGGDFSKEQATDGSACIPLHRSGLEPRPAPPPGGPGHLEVTRSHVYSTTGSRDVQGDVTSGVHDGTWPALYGSYASARVTITVHE